MSAESYGKQLLEEVEEESLSELLKSLRDTTNAGFPDLGIESLDHVINAFENPPATRQQEIYRDASSPEPTLQPVNSKREPTVLEITSASPCSGKTQLLYLIIGIALLPERIEDMRLNGKSQAVVLFDLSSRISVLRLRDVMRDYILESVQAQEISVTETTISSLIHDSMMHLHIYKPLSTPSLIASISALSTYLLSPSSKHFSSSRALGLLCLSDLSAFMPQDRLDCEEAAFSATVDPPTTKLSPASMLNARYRDLTTTLREVHALFSPVIIATTYGLSPTLSVLGHPAIRPHLPVTWTNFCTANIVVERARARKYAPGISVVEAEAGREVREKESKKGERYVWVNWWGAEEGWKDEVKEAVARIKPFRLPSMISSMD